MALILPILFGYQTRLFAFISAVSMWGMYLYPVDDGLFIIRYKQQFQFVQVISNTGGLLALSLHGPGSFSVDTYRQKAL